MNYCISGLEALSLSGVKSGIIPAGESELKEA